MTGPAAVRVHTTQRDAAFTPELLRKVPLPRYPANSMFSTPSASDLDAIYLHHGVGCISCNISRSLSSERTDRPVRFGPPPTNHVLACYQYRRSF